MRVWKKHTEELVHGLPFVFFFTGDHSRLAVILYAPGSVYDDKVKADVAEGIIVVANQDPEAEVGASAGVVGGSSLVCSGALPVLKNSTDCSTVAGTVNVS